MADRFAGIDADHCRLVLRELARLHATSIMLHVDDPDTHARIADSFLETFCVPEWEPSFVGFAERATRKAIKALSVTRNQIPFKNSIRSIVAELRTLQPL